MPVCEDLATKAEVQELRDQLNALLGEKEDGSYETLFAKGASNPVVQGAGAVTLLGMAKVTAPKAVVDIIMEGQATGSTWQKMASMNTGIKAKFGNGAVKSLQGVDAVARTAGGSAGVANAGAKIAGNGAGAVMLLGNLVNIAGTLALNKATVDILGARIETESAGAQQALNQQNTMMLRLYDKHEGDLDAVNVDIEQQNAIIANTQQAITIAQSDIIQLSSQTSTINNRLTEANQTIQQLQIQNAEAANQINELETELTEAKAELTLAVGQVETQLNQAVEIVTKMQLDAQKTTERVTLLETKVSTIELSLSQSQIDIANLQANVIDLQEDIELLQDENEAEGELVEIKTKIASAKLIIEQHRLEEQRKKRGGSFAAINGAAAAQTGVLGLASKLATPVPNTPPIPTTVTAEELLNNPQTFRDKLEQMLDLITPGVMTPEQQQQLRDDFKIDLSDGLNLAIGSLLIPNLVDLKDRTSEESISRGVQAGLCKSLNGGSCPVTPGNPNPTQGLQGMQNNLEAKLAAADLAQGAVILGYVKNTNEAVRHAKYGLEAVQQFANTAWKATHMDKVLNTLSVVIALHNAAMLSRNLGETLGDLTSQALATIGIKDTEGNPLNINATISNSVNAMLTNILGAETYQGIKETWNKSSRILSSASTIVWTVRSIADSTREITEWTAENTGKIGNALKRWRVVGENAYTWMPERMTAQNKWLARVERARNGVDSLDDAASSFSSVLGEVQNIQQEYSELSEQGTKFKDNIKQLEPNEREQNEPVQLARQDEREVSKSPSSQADVFRGEGEPD